MAWDKLPLQERLEATHVDIMRHKDFARIGGVVMIGKNTFSDELPTAATNGEDTIYNPEFFGALNRKQARYLVLHENFHKALHHCTAYKAAMKQYPVLTPRAADYVVNLLIEELDPHYQFAERPTQDLLFDKKYTDMGILEVLRDLIKQDEADGKDPKRQPGQAGGDGDEDGDGTLDEHQMGNEAGGGDPAKVKALAEQIDEAIRQGVITANNLAGKGGRNHAIDGAVQDRNTDWRNAMREFATSVCQGHDLSRLSPPNKRFAPLGVLLWSHFAESTGELVIACDTSGSMGGIYPVVFGEIARICQLANPEAVRIVWWDSEVCGEQVFKQGEYENISQLLKPKGGGGTEPQCVTQHIRKNDIKAKGIIWLTDGYLYSSADLSMDIPQLWGVVDNPRFVPPTGKLVHINSIMEGV